MCIVFCSVYVIENSLSTLKTREYEVEAGPAFFDFSEVFHPFIKGTSKQSVIAHSLNIEIEFYGTVVGAVNVGMDKGFGDM